ncbi:sulfatase-like hydrolase/transferase [Halomicrococcus gelatinilyticus]|uniref:sulfatase-like hydrolase/transferase n=1 Tax=Halomicrococcus gelatinilyticus TaxID=1702103 RepID=UPI002E14CA84
MNVALVVLDTLRKDAFDDHFDWLPGVRFERAFSTSHWTVPAHASLFAGRYASELGVYAGAQLLDCQEPVLAEQFQAGGYTTRAFSANVNVSRPFDFHRGFDQFEGSWRLRALAEDSFDWDRFIVETEDVGPQRYLYALKKVLADDCATVPSLKRGALLKLRDLGWGRATRDDGAAEALEFVRDTAFGDDEFLFVNLMEAHTPYDPPEEYQTVDPPELNGLRATLDEPGADPERIRQAYDDSVRYLSDVYRDIFAELSREFDYVVTLADHGEALGERGDWEHLCGLAPEITQVPLCISGEGLDGERREAVSLLDVHRTVLDLADLEGESRGRNLLGDDLEDTDESDGERPPDTSDSDGERPPDTSDSDGERPPDTSDSDGERPPDTSDSDGERPPDTDWLVGYHGLTDRHRTALARDGFDPSPLDRELHALASRDYYGWETPDGFREVGETEDPRDRLDALLDDLDRTETENDVAVSEAVEAQLRDLGYA